jgi:Fic family protein
MKSFEKKFIKSIRIDNELLKIVREIGEYRGKEDLFKQQAPQTLETLVQNAIIQSTESSNRIEGIEAESPERLKALMKKKSRPKNRSEQEIAGYRDVLNLIHHSHDHMYLNSNLVLQLHRDLFKFSSMKGGNWKATDNDIVEVRPDGKKVVRFKPTPAWQTEDAMDMLHLQFKESSVGQQSLEPLLGIASYVLDFLCIHPFTDGNGRMARLLTLLLLYRNGYQVGRFISLERIIEDTKETYYEALHKSSQGWHEGKHDIGPWWNYFLGVVIRTAYKEFADRVGSVETSRGAKGALVIAAIERLPIKFTASQLVEKCPTVGIDYIRKVLRQQRLDGKIKSTGRGPDAAWMKVGK